MTLISGPLISCNVQFKAHPILMISAKECGPKHEYNQYRTNENYYDEWGLIQLSTMLVLYLFLSKSVDLC